MTELFLALLASLPATVAVDAIARPRATGVMRKLPAVWLMCLVALFFIGFVSAISGNPVLALIAVIALHLLVVLASNAKMRMLGEPLLFSDLALVGAMFRHPQFYFSVLTLWQKIIGIVASLGLVVVLSLLFEPDLAMALAGASIALATLALLVLSLRLEPFRSLAPTPDIQGDVIAYGVVPTLLVYWLRWRRARKALALEERASVSAPAPSTGDNARRVIVVVQCESFADPGELFGSAGFALPALEKARNQSVQWGNLLVSGFGAYTMRTEYGVLFGTDEDTLGFRLYDPYLTALEDPALALPQRLGPERWRSFFVHPHDMRFYGRDQILPKAGFAELVGERNFPRPDPEQGRYVTDAAVAQKILEIAETSPTAALIYAVTMENHGPWAAHGNASVDLMVESYNRLVRAGDEMLGQLMEGLTTLGKPATLVFFGDHRPSIPGASTPGGDRHTPYVIVQFDAEGTINGAVGSREDLTPAQLHDAILKWGARIEEQ